MPKITSAEQGMRLAITGAIMDQVIGDHLLADYLLNFLNSKNAKGHLEFFKLAKAPRDTLDFIYQVAQTKGTIGSNNVLNVRNSVQIIMKAFRDGKLGRFTLDDIPKVC